MFIFLSALIQAILMLESCFCAGVIITLQSILGHAINLCDVLLCDNFQPAPYGAKHTVYFLTMNVY